ncbi:MAG: DUF1080 domain-containing protein [Pirellulaceae bacterium]|nr:DUF1080 domain-containing protein [Planctomycetales bacterium]
MKPLAIVHRIRRPICRFRVCSAWLILPLLLASVVGATASAFAQESDENWKYLFRGTDLESWRGYRSAGRPSGWVVENGNLTLKQSTGDLVSVEIFQDFELVVEWTTLEGGNSGIIYRATEEDKSANLSGLEYQILRNPAAADPLTIAGALYGLYPARRVELRSPGQWNESRVVVLDRQVEHWLNGVKVCEFEIGSVDWQKRVERSGYAELPYFAKSNGGHIVLQDRGTPVWYRTIRVRPLVAE